MKNPKYQAPKNDGIPFRFTKGASIGEPDAESDEKYLDSCFVNTGDYQILANCKAPQRIIIGRTGAGKSALIYHLKQNEENVIEILPENLSLSFISNSDIVSNLEKAGVKMDIFYTLLWKHVFAVELLKHKFKLVNEEKTKSWIAEFLTALRKKDQSRERALEYLRDWGDKFWYETEYRIKEITQKLENEVTSKLGLEWKGLNASTGGADKITEEKRIEVVQKAQRIVNDIQVKALSDVLHFLSDDVFNDPQESHYLVIDKLDENWVDDDLRYRLIRALIETVKSYRIIPSVKIIVGLRQDLIQSVFERTRDSGFQEEKYQALFLHLRWDKKSLEELLDNRVSLLVREQYTTRPISLREIFPLAIGQVKFIDYLFTRTLYRPRDAIAFINECLKRSAGQGSVTVGTVREAEIEYSAQRIDSLNYEWIAHYPDFPKYLKLLERMPAKFKLSLITKEMIEEFAITYVLNNKDLRDPVSIAAYKYINNGNNHHSVVIELVKALYVIGVLGIKPDGFTGDLWSYVDIRSPTDGQIKPSSIALIHPMIWARMGVQLMA